MSDENEGVYGPESLRLKGMTIDQLPIAEAAIAKQQMPDFLKSQKQNEIERIQAQYPKQSIAWIEGAIRECQSNMKNVRMLIAGQNKMINDYMGHISLCKHREKLLKHETDEEEIRKIKKQYPPYNIKAMKQQIKQCREAINRSNDVIDKEHESISELRELMVKCKERDAVLKTLGVAA